MKLPSKTAPRFYISLLKNLIFLDCKQRGLEVFYYRTNNNLEVDFIIKEENKLTAVQVYYTATKQDTFQREVRDLSKDLAEFTISDSRIKHVPAYEWLLR